MSNSLGFHLFDENDYVDFDQINYNFRLLDNMGLCIESGSVDVTGGGTSVTWRYKRFVNNSGSPKYTIDASCTVLSDDSWSCTDQFPGGYCWSSRVLSVPLPPNISAVNIYDIQGNIRLSANTSSTNVNWMALEKIDSDSVLKFRAISPILEPSGSGIAKVAYFNVKAISM